MGTKTIRFLKENIRGNFCDCRTARHGNNLNIFPFPKAVILGKFIFPVTFRNSGKVA